ncbi:MAG TPA: hypothetical protein ENK10_10330 [Acidobacteria bacterium]|nr:hypothetical protein [Acidobacteriota bacterium]
MKREFTYTKQRLIFILEDLLSRDIHGGPRYQAPENVEEGFEKRATLEFLLWFLAEAFPDGMSFHCSFDDLEEDYPEALARVIADGKGWAARHVCEQEQAENVVFVDFRKP